MITKYYFSSVNVKLIWDIMRNLHMLAALLHSFLLSMLSLSSHPGSRQLCIFRCLLEAKRSFFMLALRTLSRAAATRRLLVSRSFTQTVVMANTKSESEWRAILTPEQFRILRQKGMESGTGSCTRINPKVKAM